MRSPKRAIEDQVIVITGASSGIGLATARMAAKRGARVVVSARNAEDLAVLADEITAAGGFALAHAADVSDARAVEALKDAALDRFGRIDTWVNNAGIMTEVPVAEMSTATWDETILTNLRSVFLCTRAVLPTMLAQRSGSIINISSQLGLKGAPNCAHYAASKAGILAFTKSVAKEVGAQGIRVNAIAPGPLRSPMTDPFATPEWVAAKLTSQVLPRFGEVEEVAATAVFLASDAASLYLGQTLSPNAGGVM